MQHLEVVMYLVAQLFSHHRVRFFCLQTRNLSTESRSLFSEVIHLIKIILIAPRTYAITERSFSTLKRVKTSILSTDSRLNHFVMINIYNEVLDESDIKLITNEFIKVKDFRIATFRLYEFLIFV